MLKIDTEKNVNFSIMFIIIAVAMYIASRINTDKFIELFAITSLDFTHVFPWRFITYCFYFGESPFFFFFTILVLMIFAVKLESIWGTFYFAAFLLMSIVCRSIASFLFGAELPIVDWMNVYTSLVIAFGFNFTEDTMYLFFVIPIKMKFFSIAALIFLGISLLNTLLYPMCINLIQTYGAMFPSEYQTLVDEYYHAQLYYRAGLIHVSPLISPFLVKALSYLGLIVFAPKIFNFDHVKHFINPRQEKFVRVLNELKNAAAKNKSAASPDEDDDDDDEDWPDDDEIKSLASHSEESKPDKKEPNGQLCDEADFEPDDDYCKTCRNYKLCLERDGHGNIEVDVCV